MKIEALNGEDGKTVVRVTNEGEETNGVVLEPGQKIGLSVRDVHEPSRIHFGEVEAIQSGDPTTEEPIA